METQIKESLISLLNGINCSDGQIVATEMARLDQLLETERAALPAQLAHFLARRSYAKALAYLNAKP